MTCPPQAPAGTPIWCHLETPHLAEAIKFYEGLFGWEYRAAGPDADGMGKFYLAGKAVAGIEETPDAPAARWQITLHTPDAAQAARAIPAAGGQVVSGPTEFAGQGVLVDAIDAAGARVYLWEPRGDDGFEVRHVPGATEWFECWTTDYPANVKFYWDVAGWAVAEGPPQEGYARYALNGDYENSTALIGELAAPPRDPAVARMLAEGQSRWVVDFAGDPVALLARARELGGTITAEPWHDPDAGTSVEIVDPHGATFAVIGADV